MARLFVLTGLFLGLVQCGGSGGGGNGSEQVAPSVLLREIEFYDPSQQLRSRDLKGPRNASLLQQINLQFNGRVNIDEFVASAITIRDMLTGDLVNGRFVITEDSTRVTFVPQLPTRETRLEPLGWQGDASFLPDRDYQLALAINTPDAISNLGGVHFTLRKRYGFLGDSGFRDGKFTIDFRTTNDPEQFWGGFESKTPELVRIYPDDGTENIELHRFVDLSTWDPFWVEFDAPLDPSSENIGQDLFHLVDLTDSEGNPVDRQLPFHAFLEKNDSQGSRVRIDPVGLLPPGHQISIRVDSGVKGLAGGKTTSALAHTLSTLPDEGPRVDFFVEDFSTNEYQEPDPSEIEDGLLPADWNVGGSKQLEAFFDFPGNGELGPFIPIPDSEDDKVIVLDTDRQEFPLPDGSTPGVRSRTFVDGGVFNFSEIDIPERVIIVGRGSNPLVLSATDGISIAGQVVVDGEAGDDELSKNQALSPLLGGRGGPGGGRGGDGHPTKFDPVSGAFVSPAFGEPGLPGYGSALRGGSPGQSGVYGEQSVTCGNGKGKAAGGGGGSFVVTGEVGLNGQGNEDKTTSEREDENGIQIFVELEGGTTIGGQPGLAIFRDGSEENDFFGRRGEYQFPIGGQGGGGGGSRLDSLHCEGKYPGLPTPTADSRGGGGGGGGGILELLCLNNINLRPGANLRAIGGAGGKGENSNSSPRAGGGGGGSGGVIRLMAAGLIRGFQTRVPRIEVIGGAGAFTRDWGSGGDGAPGLVQIQAAPDSFVREDEFVIVPEGSLVDLEKTPSEFTSVSVGQSRWIYFGDGVFRDSGTGPAYAFSGTDEDGFVITNDTGFLPEPESSSIRIDQLPVVDPGTGRILENGFKDRIPENANVKVEFQGAFPYPESDEVNPDIKSAWTTHIADLNGYPVIRYRITMDIAKSIAYKLSLDLPRIAIREVKIRCRF